MGSLLLPAGRWCAAAALMVTSAGALSIVACGGDDAPGGDPPVVDAGETDSTTPPTGDASVIPPGTGPQVDCVIGAAIELEDNNTAGAANPFTELSFCGVISPGTDVDFSSFETPPGQTLTAFQAIITGKVDFELTTGGKTFGPADTELFVPGKYVVKAFTTDKKPGTYRMRLQFDPK